MKQLLIFVCLLSTLSLKAQKAFQADYKAQTACQVNYKLVCAQINEMNAADVADSIEIAKIEQRIKARQCDKNAQLIEKEKLAVCIAREGSQLDIEAYKRQLIEAINAVPQPKRVTDSKYLPCKTGDCQ